MNKEIYRIPISTSTDEKKATKTILVFDEVSANDTVLVSILSARYNVLYTEDSTETLNVFDSISAAPGLPPERVFIPVVIIVTK